MTRPDKERPALAGVLVVDKPQGITSFGVVARVRRAAQGAKTGHAGTLDPLATGVLVLALGSATRMVERLMATDKRYRTVIDLSAFTTTDDQEGERTEMAVPAPPDESTVRAALARFVGRIEQRPPAFSAMKVAGVRAYRLARGGATPELPARPVDVFGIELIRYEWPLVEVALHCGKGTYVRSLARDLGIVLGTGGHCASLRRTAVGPFDESMARSLEQLPPAITQADLLSPEAALQLVTPSASP